jgi:hypothetical protein
MSLEREMEIVRLVRSFRAVLAAHVLKYRTIEGMGRSRHSLQTLNGTGFVMRRSLPDFETNPRRFCKVE